MMYEDYFAERLSALRTKKNVSAREMSLALGQNESYINRIENKKAFPSMQIFFYICEYLEITPRDFFDIEPYEPKILNDFIDDIYKLNPSQFNIIYDLVKEIIRK